MLIDALIVDRYEIKKFKLWNNIKKKTKRSYVGEILQCNTEPFNDLGLNGAWLERFMGLWSGRMQLNSAWMLRKPSDNFGKAFVQSPHWIH